MTSTTTRQRSMPTVPRRRPRARARLQLRAVGREPRIAVALGLLAVVITVLVFLAPTRTPITSLLVPLIIGSLVLGPRTLPWFVVFVMGLLTVCVSQQVELTQRTIGAVVVQFVIALVVLVSSFRRARLGVAGIRGESMFVDLRDRILNQGGIPDLPAGWVVDSALMSAGGTAFAGDFVVASRDRRSRVLQLVVVDVSGKGEEAGTRALLLSGAFGGLLGALPRDQFLEAANEYLLRQEWEEGFATAVHLWLDLATGDFEVRTAGHPPAVHRASGSGRWTPLRTEGPILGLIPDAEFSVARGRLGGGDTLVLYTDGMVEEPRRDIDLGIDRLLGEAEALVHGEPEGAARRLAATLGSRTDDRAIVLVHRR